MHRQSRKTSLSRFSLVVPFDLVVPVLVFVIVVFVIVVFVIVVFVIVVFVLVFVVPVLVAPFLDYGSFYEKQNNFYLKCGKRMTD
jgi:uncharacterized membrane protein